MFNQYSAGWLWDGDLQIPQHLARYHFLFSNSIVASHQDWLLLLFDLDVYPLCISWQSFVFKRIVNVSDVFFISGVPLLRQPAQET